MAHLDEIDGSIARKHLLKHPFYQAWTDGTLPRESLVDYIGQYYAFESVLPRLLTALHARCDDAATRAVLLENAWDEEHGENNHPELWLRFADGLGVPRADVIGAVPHESTRALLATYREAAERAPVAAGVAAVYAYESQLPAVAEAKIAGLKAHFGVESRSALAFFEVHRALDAQHAAAERRVLERASDEDGRDAAAWACQALDAWWAFLDGVLPAARS
jgi:pyrroloquinoline-quinone synthase